MRLMAYGAGVGVLCDQCDRREVNENGLRGVLGAQVWFHHILSLNHHVCAPCVRRIVVEAM